MSDITITTNGHARELFAAATLTNAQLNHFGLDYITDPDEQWSDRLFRYRGWVYDANEFVRIIRAGEVGSAFMNYVPKGSPLEAWHGAQPSSAFDAIVIRYPFEWDGITVDYGAVVVGHATW